MIATVEKHFEKWSVKIVQGHQTFWMDKDSKREAQWYAKQFNTALRYYKAEIVKDTLGKVSDWLKGVCV